MGAWFFVAEDEVVEEGGWVGVFILGRLVFLCLGVVVAVVDCLSLAFSLVFTVCFALLLLPLESSLVVRDALVDRRSDMNLSNCVRYTPRTHSGNRGGENAYNTAARSQRLSLAPKLIPIPLDVIHPVEDDDTVASEQAPGPRVGHPARLLLRARIVVHRARMIKIVVCGYDMDLVGCLCGRKHAGVEERLLGFLEGGGELVRAVGEP